MDRGCQSGSVALITGSRRIDADALPARSRPGLLGRNAVFEAFFEAEAPRLAPGTGRRLGGSAS